MWRLIGEYVTIHGHLSVTSGPIFDYDGDGLEDTAFDNKYVTKLLTFVLKDLIYLLQLTVLSRPAIIIEVFGCVFVLSLYRFDITAGIGAFVMGLSQISSCLGKTPIVNKLIVDPTSSPKFFALRPPPPRKKERKILHVIYMLEEWEQSYQNTANAVRFVFTYIF